ncbi:hypothetical protein BGW80DRAFT_779817 [Lactifluus volemus]|nr:hypothetical protein BGW80DRAFT_779817 [Lactifluus volemus]
MKVKELELEVRRLKKVTSFTSTTQVAVTALVSLDRKKIRQVTSTERSSCGGGGITGRTIVWCPRCTHDIKKLLRQFHRVVTSPSLGDDEECPICAEALDLNKCSSLPCQHIFCDSCLSKIGDGENISCPQCRRQSKVESFEAVEFTATQQWDLCVEMLASALILLCSRRSSSFIVYRKVLVISRSAILKAIISLIGNSSWGQSGHAHELLLTREIFAFCFE